MKNVFLILLSREFRDLCDTLLAEEYSSRDDRAGSFLTADFSLLIAFLLGANG